MSAPLLHSSLEVLEARIAPANIFVSGTASGANALKVLTDTGTNAVDTTAEMTAQTAAGATAAVLLTAGDKLYFDVDGNHLIGPRDYLLMEVTAGNAMLFLTNNSSGVNIRAFEKTEISGLALSDAFEGVVHTDINGTVATALDGANNFTGASGTLTLQAASVAGLTVEGQIGKGHLLAGQDLNFISLAGRHFNTRTAQVSVSGDIATGTAAASHTVSFNGGTTNFTTAFTPADGTDGGDIRDLTLSFGATSILTGKGADGATGNGGDGGSLINARVNSPKPVTITTGHGGNALTIGSGGTGGDITHALFSFTTTPTSAVSVVTGAGGNSAAGVGGTGGSFTDVALTLPRLAATLTMQAGDGGASGGSAKGGHGGNFDTLDLEVFSLRGPAGLDERVLNVTGGDGGSGGTLSGDGGDGGGISELTYTTGKTAARSLREFFVGGAGADGALTGGSGGTGGTIDGANIIVQGPTSELRLLGGRAGDVLSATGGAGADGGSVLNVRAVMRSDLLGDFSAFGGAGGSSGGALGGSGGAVSNITYINLGAKTGTFLAQGGDGGSAFDNIGGHGGAVTQVAFYNLGSLVNGFMIAGGGHGNFIDDGPGTSSTGDGGDVSGITVTNYGALGASEIVSGGDSFFVDPVSGSGDVGANGAISNITINDTVGTFSDAHPLQIHTGMMTLLAQGDSARGGDISGLHFNAPRSSILVYGGGGAGSEANNGTGGDAGDISNVTGRVSKLTVIAGNGGSAFAGAGGAGGNVHDISLSFVGKFLPMIAAGDGGSGSTAGSGGSVSDVSVAGMIGDITKSFSLFESHLDDPGSGAIVGMGGLVAGQAGTGGGGATNGLIANVSATRIAAIIAGRPLANQIGYENAVTSITNLHTNVLGADVNRNGVFNFTEGGTTPGYQPDDMHNATDGDTALDGLVIVKLGGFTTFPVNPLKLIQV